MPTDRSPAVSKYAKCKWNDSKIPLSFLLKMGVTNLYFDYKEKKIKSKKILVCQAKSSLSYWQASRANLFFLLPCYMIVSREITGETTKKY